MIIAKKELQEIIKEKARKILNEPIDLDFTKIFSLDGAPIGQLKFVYKTPYKARMIPYRNLGILSELKETANITVRIEDVVNQLTLKYGLYDWQIGVTKAHNNKYYLILAISYDAFFY